MKVSACMIVKNESKNIERCINSFIELADEIIIVDTGSTDNTVKIAEGLGAKVFFRAWDNDFAAAKNYALDQAAGDWIIILDADEYFESGSMPNLRKALQRIDKNKNTEAVQCRLYNIEEKKNLIIGSMPAVRIIRNRPDIRFYGRIHEAPKREGKFLNNEYLKDIKIYHTGYSLDIVQSKRERNLEMLKLEEKSGNADSFIYYYLAEVCAHLNKYEEAITYADIFIGRPDFKDMIKTYPQAFRIYIHKSHCMCEMKECYTEEEILDVITEGIKQFPFHPELIIKEAEILFKYGRLEKAIDRYKESIKANEKYDYLYSNNFESIEDKVKYSIGEILQLKGDSGSAMSYMLQALMANKYNAKAFNGIIGIIRNKNHSEMIQFLNNLYNMSDFRDMEFLSINLAKQKVTAPFLYYFIKNWQWEYEDYGNLIIIALLLKGDTGRALETAFSLLAKERNDLNELYLTIVLIYGNHAEWFQKNKQQLSSVYRSILDLYFDGANILKSTDEIMKCYQKILSELFSFEDKKVFYNFMEKTPALWMQSFEIVGDIFKDDRYYDLAIDNYKKALENNISRNTDDICIKIGFCNYHLERYEESIDYYEQGLICKENRSYEPVQFLEWIKEKNIDEKLKNRIDNLIKIHSKNKKYDSFINPFM